MRNDFTEMVIDLVLSIPEGRVATYGGLAAMAGNARGARQVARILSSCSQAEDLPWWRVVNREGKISLPPGGGYEEQRDLLEAEGIGLDAAGRIDLNRFGLAF